MHIHILMIFDFTLCQFPTGSMATHGMYMYTYMNRYIYMDVYL